MQKDKSINKWTEMFILTFIMTAFLYIGISYMPYMLIIFPAPFIVYNIKNDIRLGVMSLILSTIIIGLLTNIGVGVISLLIFGPIILALSLMIMRKETGINTIMTGVIVFFISVLILIIIVKSENPNFKADLDNLSKDIIVTQTELIKDINPDIKAKDIDKLEETLEKGFKMMMVISPAIIIIISTLVSYLNYLLGIIGLQRMDIDIVPIPKFNNMRLPRNLLPGTLIMLLITFFVNRLGIIKGDMVMDNIIIIFGFLLFVQGISVIDYYFARRGMNGIFRFILFGLIFMIIPFIMNIIYFIGIFDMIFDFRKLDIRTNK